MSEKNKPRSKARFDAMSRREHEKMRRVDRRKKAQSRRKIAAEGKEYDLRCAVVDD